MRHMIRAGSAALFSVFLVMFATLSPITVTAQPEDVPAATLTDDEIIILEAINQDRVVNGLVPFTFSAQLQEVANILLTDLAARTIGGLGDIYVTRDGQNIDSLLTAVGYEAYPEPFGYAADVLPIIIRDIEASTLFDYMLQDSVRQPRTIFSRNMVRGGVGILPVRDTRYREVGVAALHREDIGRYYYVIVTASRPEYLPIFVTDGANLGSEARMVTSRDIRIYIPDERAIPRNADASVTFGRVQYVRISETDEALECPEAVSDPWERYLNSLPYRLSAGAGTKTLYVQMCDGLGRSITMTAEVTYEDSTSAAPNLLPIVGATQTAAAAATQIAPYQPTIEAILTATAEVGE